MHDAVARAKYITNKGTYLSWVKYFKEGAGQNSVCQLAAFFAYWFSFFAFPTPLDDGVNPFVFPMADLLP